MHRTCFFILNLSLLNLCFGASPAGAEPSGNRVFRAWSDAALVGARDSRLPAPEIARALAVVHTCIYDAWAAYDDRATGTQLKGVLRRPTIERTQQNKEQAISFAAFRALTDLLPVDNRSLYVPLLKKLGFSPDDRSTDLTSPAGIANVACGAVLEYRHHDKSNQLGDLSPGPYTDWTGYVPRNRPTGIPVTIALTDPDHWQPLVSSTERATG